MFRRKVLLSLLIAGSAPAQINYSDPSTDPICIDIRRQIALTAAIKEKTAAMIADALQTSKSE